jgi:hypothetical protein
VEIPEGAVFPTDEALSAQAKLEADLAALVERYAPPVGFKSYDEFAAVEERSAEPLLGTATETILPADGMLLMYGDGGAGKTTLSIDAAAHLGSGSAWLGVSVPRPMRVAIIENEGPRGKFRQMLSEKKETWARTPFSGNLTVLEEPWTQFTLQQDEHRLGLAEHVMVNDVDVVLMGPLVTLGMVGGGTPDEVSRFEALVAQTRASCKRPFALWVVHHENKSGDVSGAWERVPDTMCHVQPQGNGHTLLHWRKARWSSENHGTSLELIWTAGRSFELKEAEERDPWSEMLDAFRSNDEWRTAKEAGKLIGLSEHDAKKVLAGLVRRGEMRFEKGPQGRHATAQCYRLEGALGGLAHLSAPTSPGAGAGALRTPPPPFREGESSAGAPRAGSNGAPAPQSSSSAPDDNFDW